MLLKMTSENEPYSIRATFERIRIQSIVFSSIHWGCFLLQFVVSVSAVTPIELTKQQIPNQPRKILLPLPLLAKAGSHCGALRVISSALVDRGHQVQLLRSSEKPCGVLDDFNATGSFEYQVPDISAEFNKVRVVGQEVAANQLDLQKLTFFFKVCKVFAGRCRNLLEESDLLENLRQQKFDVIIADLFTPCYALLAEYLDLPLIIITTSREYIFFHRQLYGYPSELSYIPEFGSGLSSQLDVIGRVKNIIARVITRVMRFICLQNFRTILADLAFSSSSLDTIMTNRTKLWLSYSSLALDYPEPVMPNTVFVGGMAIKDSQPLSKELEEFVQGSGEHGVIIFSLGSMIGSLGNEMTSMIANTFRQLPQRVIWKHEGDAPPNVGSNTMVMNWIPQNDLLGHPKTRLFIGHGGINGVYEALYHGVPMLLIPVVAPDQWDNAVRVVSNGMGKSLDFQSITQETLYEAITDVLQNDRYQESVRHHSAILRDLSSGPDQAIFWIEHVLKFGDKHLRAQSFELSFIEYYLIDVAAVVTIVAMMFYYVVRCICRLCCRTCMTGKQKCE